MKQRTKMNNIESSNQEEFTWEDKINELKSQLHKENNNMELSHLENPRKQLLQTNGKTDGHHAWILIDCGATENFISQNFVKQQRLETRSVGSLSVQLPDG
jgi:hypothetical protein